jgi:hypothetical protein
LIQRNQVFMQPAVHFRRIRQPASVQQALHPLVGGMEKDAQLVDVVGLGVLLHSLPEATADPLPLESILDQNAGFGGWRLYVRLAHVVGDTHDGFAPLLHCRHKARPSCWIKAVKRGDLVQRRLAMLEVAIVETFRREPPMHGVDQADIAGLERAHGDASQVGL